MLKLLKRCVVVRGIITRELCKLGAADLVIMEHFEQMLGNVGSYM
jgi:hypothetical protein